MPSITYTVGTVYDPNNYRTFTPEVYTGPADPYKILSFEFYNAKSGEGQYIVGSTLPGPISLNADFTDNTGAVNFTGGDNSDILRGGSGSDTLNGDGGNDILSGGTGDNTIDGGAGKDTADYTSYQSNFAGISGVSVDLGAGTAIDFFPGGATFFDTLINIENIRGSAFIDSLTGDGNRNVIEGGAGSDDITGGGGADVASYLHASTGVTVDMTNMANNTGDAAGDTFTGIENLYGSTFADTLTGDDQANIIFGQGGADHVEGGGGNDRIVIKNTEDGMTLDGGTNTDGSAGMDTLVIQRGGQATLTDSNFTGFERVVVSNGANVDLSGVTTGERIYSQSLIKGSATITGTQANDVIFGGAGRDTFSFNDQMAAMGRDVIYNAVLADDMFDVAGLGANDIGDLIFKSINGGTDTMISNVDAAHAGDSFVLKGITAAQAEGAHFVYAAPPA